MGEASNSGFSERTRRALLRWPDVPDVYGWLRLDSRGRWLIAGQLISRQQIIAMLNQHYRADARGCWYVQNGPQRGFVALDYAPFVLRRSADGQLQCQRGQLLGEIRAIYLDENGALSLLGEAGLGLLHGDELDWALGQIKVAGAGLSDEALESALESALAAASGSTTELTWRDTGLAIQRLNFAVLPAQLGFVRQPSPD